MNGATVLQIETFVNYILKGKKVIAFFDNVFAKHFEIAFWIDAQTDVATTVCFDDITSFLVEYELNFGIGSNIQIEIECESAKCEIKFVLFNFSNDLLCSPFMALKTVTPWKKLLHG